MPLDTIKEEIERLHVFLSDWYAGTKAEAALETEFVERLSPDLVLIPPAGFSLGRQALVESLKADYASNDEFRIQIRNVKIAHQSDELVLATYEEWQRNALNSTPPNNGRVATVLFRVDTELSWLHIHETWLPQAVMEADSYDF